MFKDKVVWITGASSGIGESMAVQVANEGGKVVLSARTESKLQELKAKLQNSEYHLIIPLDLEKSGNFEDLVKHQIIEGKVHSIRTSLNYTEAIIIKTHNRP